MERCLCLRRYVPLCISLPFSNGPFFLSKAIPSGTEITVSYGALSNSHLLATHGFVLDVNPKVELQIEVTEDVLRSSTMTPYKCECSTRAEISSNRFLLRLERHECGRKDSAKHCCSIWDSRVDKMCHCRCGERMEMR